MLFYVIFNEYIKIYQSSFIFVITEYIHPIIDIRFFKSRSFYASDTSELI